MVTFAELRQAGTSTLRAAGQAWWDHAGSLRGFGERMNTEVAAPLVHSGWTGEVAGAALDRGGKIEQVFEGRSLAAELVAGVYDTAYERLWRLQWQLTVAVDAAHSEGMSVREDGVVEAPPPTETELIVDGGTIVVQRAQRARELTARIAGIVAEADAVDEQTASALTRLSPADSLGPAGWQELTWDARGLASEYGLSEQDIPAGNDPAANASWWDRLTPAEQAMYLAAYPSLVGGLDGLPVEARDRANQLALRGVVTAYTVDDATRERAQSLLDQVEVSETGPAAQRLHIIGYDLSHDGRAIISVGNPDTAEHTAVWVPGTSNTIDDIGPDLQRVRNLQHRADELTDEATGDVATVMWLGYTAPTILTAGRDTSAELGAPALDGFVDGLRTSHEGGPGRMTVIGHSYGSAVVGEAASAGDGLAVDDIIVAGSPGMRIDEAEDLQIDPNHVWAGAARGDQVTDFIGRFAHGPEPHEEGFGANRFEVDTTGHSDYWKRDTLSLDNQAKIVIGEYDLVRLEHGEPPR